MTTLEKSWKNFVHPSSNLTKKLLVVDDSPGELQLIYKVLSKAGYTIITASDGAEGIEKSLSEQPDLIILDVVMPKKTASRHAEPSNPARKHNIFRSFS